MVRSNSLIVLMVTVLFGAAIAQEAPNPKKADVVRGRIAEIRPERVMVKVPGRKGEPATERSLTFKPESTFTLEEQPARVEDLRADMSVTVLLDLQGAVQSIRALHPRVTGRFVRTEGQVLTVAVKEDGKSTQLKVTVAPDAKIEIDGKPASFAEITPGMRVTVPRTEAAVETVIARTRGGGGPADDKRPTTEGEAE
jgi:hypothetical protein